MGDDDASASSPPPRKPSATHRWLSRLAFSFIIIAAFLVWEAFHLPAAVPGAGARRALYLIAAAMAMGLGFAGIRARHQMLRDPPD